MAFRSQTMLYILVVCLSLQKVLCRDIFTAYNHMAKLASVELELHRALGEYINSEETKLRELRKFSNEIASARQLNLDTGTSLMEYAANPIRAYRMLKRFVGSWRQMKETMEVNQDLLLARLRTYKDLMPSEVDLDGALKAIARIQETYRLPPSYISAGLRKVPTNEEQLGVEDIFTIGRDAYRNEQYLHTKIWMREARRQMNGTSYKNGVKMSDILDHLSWVEYKLGNIQNAVNYTREWLLLEPDHERAQTNLIYLQRESERNMEKIGEKPRKPNARKRKRKRKLKPHQRKRYDYDNFDWPTERENYKRLCRGDSILTYEEKQNVNKLKCSFFNKDPLLRIKPARMERVWEKPPLYIFRNFATKEEIEDLKAISEPQLSRATVHNPTTGVIEFASYRISEFAWLNDEDGHTVAKINARLGAVTQLDVTTAEGLQVQNYGMAGQYAPHFDFSRESELKLIKSFGDGNRIATALLYMNKAEAGGATVFPYVGARLKPSEGDLVFWHNLMRSGDGDFRTRHAGCPIISGTKWVANKWFHERGQEFKRPCGLTPDAE
ncbi:prolyl 4-hydroxylase subunit alpha-2-like isoform X2 [Xenia sp. Carnegie-2017]|uniref:prolyl 4-hydroxylase subunit alpha-2-like isoform X2 n=1 Tax=Xenia sp. Carnegie-2017 TaxID=2897299 RepID=UPI001F04E312|nr:prolyl 4-hydroxylase subunit alpha-2-like isoform X2 [Xenia sp. Carnegie-2017]